MTTLLLQWVASPPKNDHPGKAKKDHEYGQQRLFELHPPTNVLPANGFDPAWRPRNSLFVIRDSPLPSLP